MRVTTAEKVLMSHWVRMSSRKCKTEMQWEGPKPPQQFKYVLSVLEFQAAVKTG